MVYRRTPNVTRKLNARHEAIMAAAKSLAAEGGMNAVQIAPIAAKTGIAAGTVYRYFPSKINLVEALVEVLTEAELSALAAAVKRAPGPLSALTAALSTLAVRALQNRKIMVALLVEPVEPEMEAARSTFRQALLAELIRRVEAAMAAGHLPPQNVALTTPALLGALRDGLIGPDAREPDTSGAARDLIQTVTLLCLRALGIVDARARGLVVQADLSAVE